MNATDCQLIESFDSVTNWSEFDLDYNTQIQLFLNNPSYSEEIESREGTVLIAADDECSMAIPSDAANVYFKAGSCAGVMDLELGDISNPENVIFGKGSLPDAKTVHLHGDPIVRP